MRDLRNKAEYPDGPLVEISIDYAKKYIVHVEQICDVVEALLPGLTEYAF